MEQIKTELIFTKLSLSVETLSILQKLSLDFLEFSISGVTIEIFGFSIELHFIKVNFLIVIFFEELRPYFLEKNRFEFCCESKSWNFWALSVNFSFDSTQKPKWESFFLQSCTTSRSVSFGILMEHFRLVAKKKSNLKVRILQCQKQVLEESENQNCQSKIEVYDSSTKSVYWNVKGLMDTLMEQIKTQLIWNKLILSIETLSILWKHSFEFLECSISGVAIETFGFSIEFYFTKKNILIVIFFEKVSPYFMEKNRFEFWGESKKMKFSSTFSQLRFCLSPKEGLFAQLRCRQERFRWELDGRFWAGRYEEKQFEGQDFTMSKASFGWIGESELPIKDRSIWFFNQVCLLKCKGFDGHSDGTNQNWVDFYQTDFEYRYIIHIIKISLDFL